MRKGCRRREIEETPSCICWWRNNNERYAGDGKDGKAEEYRLNAIAAGAFKRVFKKTFDEGDKKNRRNGN
jgi:hypothetical protein